MIHTETRLVPVGDLTPWPGNPRRGNVDVIVESLEANGQYRPIVVRASTMEVLAGNHTLEAAKRLGWGEVAATLVDCDEVTARRIVLVDNRSNDLATYDAVELLELASQVPDLSGTGWTAPDLEAFTAGVPQVPADVAEEVDEVPDATPSIAEPGDTWQLGEHRVVCGDATDPDVLRALMDGELADAMWTDPPYGVDYVGRTAEALPVHNDGAAGLPALLRDAWSAVDPHLRSGAPWYIAHADTHRMVVQQSVLDAGWRFRQNLVWVKHRIIPGHADFQYRHEPILYGFTPSNGGGASRARRVSLVWRECCDHGFRDACAVEVAGSSDDEAGGPHPCNVGVQRSPRAGRGRSVWRVRLHADRLRGAWGNGATGRAVAPLCRRDLHSVAAAHRRASGPGRAGGGLPGGGG